MNLETDLANYVAWVQRDLVRLFTAVTYQERNLHQEAERRIIYLQNEIMEMRHEIARLHSPITEPPNIEQRLSVSGGQTGWQSNIGPQSRRQVSHPSQGLPRLGLMNSSGSDAYRLPFFQPDHSQMLPSNSYAN